jgi:GntR family transcriptional regulator
MDSSKAGTGVSNGVEPLVQAIDKTIPTPLYYQLNQILHRQIESGALSPGDAIPTEKELMERYGISRATVRQAVLQLVNDGYLRREKSKGTFVTTPPNKFRFMEDLRGFTMSLTKRGIPTYSKVLEKRVEPASRKVAERLALEVGEPVFFLKRVRNVNDRPILIDYHYVPYRLCPGIEQKIADNVSLYGLLQKDYGVDLHHGWREFEPVTPSSQEEIELLEIYATTSILYVESVIYSRQGVPMNYFENKIHGKFTVDTVSAAEVE